MAIILGGDLNTDPRSRDKHYRRLAQVASNTNMVWTENDEVTFVRETDIVAQSTIDHFWVSAAILPHTYHP